MNLNLYSYRGQWLMVDCGVSFGEEHLPGIDVVMADPRFIEDQIENLVGIVLTHAHEDHLGALPYLWPRFDVPVYATPFSASVLRKKLGETRFGASVPIKEVPASGRFSVGPFDIELIAMCHSIPEAHSLVIRTEFGTVVHTGDWRLDPAPVVGPVADRAALQRVGDEGVLACICDSTNVFVEGTLESETAVANNLRELIGQFKKGRVAVACFASNIGRVQSIARAAAENGRSVGLVGRSLWRMTEAAQENGYLSDLPPFVSEQDAAFLPADKILLICTGSQGEPRAALSRIAAGSHPHIGLTEGDVVVFSSRKIPGNEKAIGRLQNNLSRLGCEIVTESDHFVHVSGHPGRIEMAELYDTLRPEIAVPVHGEERHLREHLRFAETNGVTSPMLVENGNLLRLAPGPAEVVDEVMSGRLCLDGRVLIPVGSPQLRDRNRMMVSGSAVATVVLDGDGGLVAEPLITVHGLFDDDEVENDLTVTVAEAVEALPRRERLRDEPVIDAARLAVRRALNALMGKKPVTDVHLIRL